jgi:hypothetical protein
MRFELTTFSLATKCSTPELHPQLKTEPHALTRMLSSIATDMRKLYSSYTVSRSNSLVENSGVEPLTS